MDRKTGNYPEHKFWSSTWEYLPVNLYSNLELAIPDLESRPQNFLFQVIQIIKSR